jgi:tetratricopeptide (TPR) repeat protein
MQDMRRDFRTTLCLGDYDQAERLATNQLALEGESSYWLNEMGLLLLVQGRLPEALLHFDRAAAADSLNAEALLNGAVMLADLGFYDESQLRFEAVRAIENSTGKSFSTADIPMSAGASTGRMLAAKHTEMGRLFNSTGNQQKATEEFTRSISLRDNSESHIELARIALKNRMPEETLQELEAARMLDQSNPEVHVIAAQCHLANNRTSEAMAALSQAELLDDRSRTGSILRHTIRN